MSGNAKREINKKNPFDPLGLFSWMRPLQEAWLDNVAKIANQAVESPNASKASGNYLDASLRVIEPMQAAVGSVLTRLLHQMSLPSRAEIAALAERLTQIERRLDDIAALLHERK